MDATVKTKPNQKILKMWKKLRNWVMGRGWTNVEVNDRKSLDFLKEMTGRNRDFNGDSGKGVEEMKRRESFYFLREYEFHHEQDVGRK